MPHLLSESSLSVRAFTRLRDAGVTTLEELAEWHVSRLLALDGFGQSCLAEVRSELAQIGLELSHHKKSPRRAAHQKPRNQEIRRRRAAGETLEAIGQNFGLSRQRIEQLCEGVIPQRQDPDARHIQREYLTASDAAAELGISRFTMHEYLQAGKLPGAFQIGQRRSFWLVPRQAIEKRKQTSRRSKITQETP
jgi:hypothetical protein